jgi:hypothetical protein
MGRYATGVINVRHAWHATGRSAQKELLIVFELKQKCDKKLKTFGLHETRTF